MSRYLIIMLSFLGFNLVASQTKELKGIVFASGDIENIHVLNTTSKKNATTNQFGEFVIQVKVKDTILFSSVQYVKKVVVITSSDFKEGLFTVSLEDQVNELDEVIVGKVLTGNLASDIANLNIKRPINFYDLGIPGYTGPKKSYTFSEKLLSQATTGGTIISIINTISGRKKRLEEMVLNERIFILRDKIEEEYKDSFFATFKLNEKYHIDFFYFCAEDENFLKRCEKPTGLSIITFLEEKLVAYKKAMAINED